MNVNYQNIIIPDKVKNIIGMCSENERKYLYHYAKNYYTGNGKIVDLGCWLGATTLALASGIEFQHKSELQLPLIYAYDLFRWDNSLEKQAVGSVYADKFKSGDDYSENFCDNIKEYADKIEIKSDIKLSGWNGDKIEFLLIDAMKTQETVRLILDCFYPFLIKGNSFIYHQDFDHYLTPWVHILIYLHSPYFKHIHDVPGSGGTVFKYVKAMPRDVLMIDFMQLTEKEADKAFNYCQKIAHKSKSHGIAAAHVMYYVLQKKLDKAFYVWTYYLWEGYELNNDFFEVKNLLDKARTTR